MKTAAGAGTPTAGDNGSPLMGSAQIIRRHNGLHVVQIDRTPSPGAVYLFLPIINIFELGIIIP
jgi:hypothetical protein